MLDYRIETFLDLCQTRSYTKTAENLFITQPAVTGHIKILEKEYNAKLFTYTNKRLYLTESGEILYRNALAVRVNTIELRQRMKSVQKSVSINFGATKTIGEFVIPPMLKKYTSLHQKTNFNITIDNTEKLLHLLDVGEISFALIEGNFDTNNYAYDLLQEMDFFPFCAIDSPLTASNDPLTDIREHCLILRENGSGTRSISEQVLLENYLSLDSFIGVTQSNSFAVIKSLVCANHGFSFCYEAVIAKELSDKSLCPIDAPSLVSKRRFHIVSMKNKLFTEDIADFFNFYQKNM